MAKKTEPYASLRIFPDGNGGFNAELKNRGINVQDVLNCLLSTVQNIAPRIGFVTLPLPELGEPVTPEDEG